MERTADWMPYTLDELVDGLTALAHPQRLRIIAALEGGRNFVSQLARDLRMSRPLLHMHLARLEGAGLVRSEMEISEDGKAMRYVELAPFDVVVNAHLIAKVVEAAEETRESEQPVEEDGR